jgi:hypothetical protein
VGQVRDILAAAGRGRGSPVRTYPTVRAAVSALTGSPEPMPPVPDGSR